MAWFCRGWSGLHVNVGALAVQPGSEDLDFAVHDDLAFCQVMLQEGGDQVAEVFFPDGPPSAGGVSFALVP